MKKIIFTIVLLGMFTWAVVDFVIPDKNDTASNGNDDHSEFVTSDEYKESDGKGTSTEVGLQTGNTAPDFKLGTLDGKRTSLSDFRGKPVMLNFWATWCPPCRAEIPDIEKFYQDSDVEVVSVNLTSTEKSLDNVKDFAKEYQMTYPVLLDLYTNVANTYAIQPLPTSFLIDSDGVIQFVASGPLNYDLMTEKFKHIH